MSRLRLRSERNEYRREAGEAIQLLREHQWSATVFHGDENLEVCPECLGRKESGHREGCAILAAIGGEGEE
jgi:hypothetical protein